MRVKLKVCGITSLEDARVAVDCGAAYLGFNFYPKSPRYITPLSARAIIEKLPDEIVCVGILVNETLPEDVVEILRISGARVAQLHGDESPEYCTQFGLMCLKAFRIRDAESLKALPAYPTDAWLLDAYVADKAGGTGEKFNWDLAIEAKKLGKPIFLAGGLTPENVAVAVQKVQPFGVDVSSGVEAWPGKKDAAKVNAFIQAVRGAGKTA